jgi:hypothetical protein
MPPLELTTKEAGIIELPRGQRYVVIGEKDVVGNGANIDGKRVVGERGFEPPTSAC